MTQYVLAHSRTLRIEGGRHPTVEQALAAQNRQFHANSLIMNHPDDAPETPSFVHVLTGPVRCRFRPRFSTKADSSPDEQNMAGKSTFLRQVAIIAVLAQAGAYVPADSAHVGVLDRLYSRVGARDELDRDRSTFMIEMDEATTILDSATDRSLVRATSCRGSYAKIYADGAMPSRCCLTNSVAAPLQSTASQLPMRRSNISRTRIGHELSLLRTTIVWVNFSDTASTTREVLESGRASSFGAQTLKSRR